MSFITSLSGEWVSLFKNTGDFVTQALCSDHVIGKFRCKQNGRVWKYLHTHTLLAYPTLKNDTPKSFLKIFFGAITAHKFNLISVVHMCEWSRGM